MKTANSRGLQIVAGLNFWLIAVCVESFAAEQPRSDTAKVPDAEHARKMAQGLEVFKAQVSTVFQTRCVKCHGGEETEGEFDLTTREGLLKGGAEGPAVLLGNAKSSRLYKLIAHAEEPFMPQDEQKLSDAVIAKIAEWIDCGAPYDKPLVDSADNAADWRERKVPDEARQWWAFRPLKPVEPTGVSDEGWGRSPIDRFVMAKLNEHGLTPNVPCTPRHLVRRLYFDLIGLPPSPEEVAAFVKDFSDPSRLSDPSHPSDTAYARLVDRLLDSKHYGERWGRHWLDVARFAESHGFEQDYDRPHAFHFRDFVIKALNDDMPYDQFVRWQIAGDEFEPENPLAMMATGFLGAGVFPTQLTEKEFEPARYDELDDMVNTLGTAMLGLTIGCSRCHDHKFDPIPSADYYRLISTFATTIRSNISLDLDPQATRQALAKWEAERAPLAASIERFEREQLPARFDAWVKERAAGRPAANAPKPAAKSWLILDLVEAKSAGGATWTRLEDGSLLASGTNPDFDTYTFVAHTHLKGITAVRLEALSHESMVKGGPGRAPNGNLGLGNFTVTAAPLSGEGSGDAKPVPVKLVNPKATFEQNTGGLSIAASIDADPKSGWAVDPQFGRDHAAVFEAAENIGFEGGTKLTFTLAFNVNNKHNIGRPRLSISTAASPVELAGASQSQAVAEILAVLDKDTEKLTEKQRATLLTWYRTLDPEWQKLNQQVQQHLQSKPQPALANVMVTSEGFPPIPHHADGRGFPHFYKETYFLKRGDTAQKQGPASPGFLQVLMSAPPSANPWAVAPPDGSRNSYRRRALANWITDTEHGAGHLLARVIVNRMWQHHLGRGIVSTVSDFGVQGQPPTHPELLDWLASQLIAGGWRLKPVHKLILTSAVYRQSSEYDAADVKLDPDNQWLWRQAPRRLEAEVIRDAMLAVSGELDGTMFGPGTLDEGMKRRSIYFMVKRSKLIPMMQLFDSPEPLVSVGGRPTTTIAPQALMFMNNPHVRSYARSFAKRVGPAADESLNHAVQQVYTLALSRPPSDVELHDGVDFLQSQIASYQSDKQPDPRGLALADFCQIVMSLNEFVYVE